MIISILKDYQIFDAGSKNSVNAIIAKMSITSSIVTLNLSKCIIDYPATSLIIDKILSELVRKKKPGILIIQTHLNILEALLLHWLFIGSFFFKIDDSKKKNSVEEFKAIIKKKLLAENLNLQIQVIDKDNKILKEYKYGDN